MRHAVDAIAFDPRADVQPNTEINGFDGNAFGNDGEAVGEFVDGGRIKAHAISGQGIRWSAVEIGSFCGNVPAIAAIGLAVG